MPHTNYMLKITCCKRVRCEPKQLSQPTRPAVPHWPVRAMVGKVEAVAPAPTRLSSALLVTSQAHSHIAETNKAEQQRKQTMRKEHASSAAKAQDERQFKARGSGRFKAFKISKGRACPSQTKCT